MEGEPAEEPTLFPANVGQKLRAAREAKGLDLSEVAAGTRIPQRHLDAIENSDYTGLPSVTYAIGFAKAYARFVGADEVEIARTLRVELGNNPERAAPTPSYELQDPARVPPRGLALAGLVVAVLVLVGVALWYGTGWFRGSTPPPETFTLGENESEAANATAAAAPVGAGQVTLVALDTVWLRVTDAAGNRLLEKEMAAGERYDVPATADRPRVRTGRPDRIQLLVNGSVVAPLGTGVETVDVEIDAAALQARGQGAAASAPMTSAGSTTTNTPATAPRTSATGRPARSAAAPTAPASPPAAGPDESATNVTAAP